MNPESPGGDKNGRVEPDLDDTVIARPRVVARPAGREADLDDTVARVPGPPTLREPGGALDPAAPPSVPVRPERFRARFGDGGVVDLDAPIYIGRRPSVPRIHSGAPARLLRVPSPAHEVSATHLELRIVGDTLVASDMRSTNGTVVILPGSTPQVLLRGASAVVVPGTVIDLGEGNRVEIVAAG